MMLMLIFLHRGFLHAETAVVGDEEWSVHHRQPLLFVKLRLRTVLFRYPGFSVPEALFVSLILFIGMQASAVIISPFAIPALLTPSKKFPFDRTFLLQSFQ